MYQWESWVMLQSETLTKISMTHSKGIYSVYIVHHKLIWRRGSAPQNHSGTEVMESL